MSDPVEGGRGVSPPSEDEGVLSAAVAVRTEASLPQEILVRRLSRVGGFGALVVLATGLVVLFGWAFQVDILTRAYPGLATMKVNTAASLTCLGAALFLTTSGPVCRARLVGAATLAVLVGLLAGLTLLEYATGSTFGFDNPFGLDPEGASTSTPGRMSPLTAVSLVLLAGTVLAILRNAVRLAQVFATASLIVGAMAILGYIYGVESLFQIGPFTGIAIHTAAAVVAASLSALALRAGEAYVGLLTGNTAGGVIIRRLLPAAVLVPLVVGGMALWGLRHGLYSEPVAFAMFASFIATGGAVLVWEQGKHLRHLDLRRAGAEDAFAATREAVRARDAMAAALAESEHQARRIIDTAADGYIAVDATGRVTDWNLAATDIFGWSRDSAVGELVERLIIPPDQVQRLRDGLAHYRDTGEGPILGQVVELPACHQEGHRLVVELTVWSVDDRQSQNVHAFVRDVTDRKLAEEQLRQANADLSDFAALVAHDLRTPLTVINGFAEMLVEASTTADHDTLVPEFAQRVQASSYRASAMIDGILAFASVGRTREDLPVDLNPLVRRAWDEQMSINGRVATIDVQALPTVNGDASLLGQLFANLLGNALKYVPAGQVAHVVVDATSDPAGRDPVVRVTDNGKAIKVEDRDRVFSMFQRGHETQQVAGTGVGLAICRKVVERHNGRIWVETAPGGGTRFCVRLGVPRRVGTAVDDSLPC